MASEIANLLNRGQERLSTLQGSPQFTWLGRLYDCNVNTIRRGASLIVGGFEQEMALTLIVSIPTLAGATSQPTAGKLVVYSGVNYRVARVSTAPGGSHYEIDLMSPNR